MTPDAMADLLAEEEAAAAKVLAAQEQLDALVVAEQEKLNTLAVQEDAAERERRHQLRLARRRETIIVLDEAAGVGFRVSASHLEISQNFPSTCRWIPDFRLIRRTGAITGACFAAAIVLLGVMVGIKESGDLGYAIGFAGVMLFVPTTIMGWMFAPLYELHDYKSFSVVRRIALASYENPPKNAWTTTHEDGEQTVYIVPYQHTFLNLANPSQEEMGDEYQPFVARASILYQDSFQKSLALVMAAKPDAWSRLKQYALLGLIGGELIFLFLMMNVMMG